MSNSEGVSDEDAAKLGRIIISMLRRPGDWPKSIQFECADHRRSLEITGLYGIERLNFSNRHESVF